MLGSRSFRAGDVSSGLIRGDKILTDPWPTEGLCGRMLLWSFALPAMVPMFRFRGPSILPGDVSGYLKLVRLQGYVHCRALRDRSFGACWRSMCFQCRCSTRAIPVLFNLMSVLMSWNY